MKKSTFLAVIFAWIASFAMAQIEEPVVWDIQHTTPTKEGKMSVNFKATVEDTWHFYSTDSPEDGPSKTEFVFEKLEGAKLVGSPKLTAGTPISQYEDLFGLTLTYYEKSATFTQQLQLTGGDWSVEGYVNFLACNDGMCMPPTSIDFSFSGNFVPAVKEEAVNAEPAEEEAVAAAEETALEEAAVPDSVFVEADSTQVAIAETPEVSVANSDYDGTTTSWWGILLAGFLAGLLAIITPCVWPMIPMTMSFFLKRTKSRSQSIKDALIYGISIIIIYVALGLIITAIFGASALNSLATNAVFNIIFFLLLVVFALSFFGAFELALPASWTTKLDEKADDLAFSAKGKTTLKAKMAGLLSIFFMAFTLCLVSFSCTGPIIGTLLVQAATSGSMLYPAIGMFGFALALALPFTLFALFPSWLQSMPKSGGWLNMVKVVLGFCELALSLKFLSVADLAYGWGILDRETFLALWIIIFVLMGMYLLGKIRLPHDDDPKPSDRVSVTRLMLALVSWSFALYMIPGLWGAPCRAISAFAPPMYTQDFNLYDDGVEASYSDFDEAMAAAKKSGKPVMVDFSGFGCVNCRKMEASVWTAPAVKQIIEEDYILVSLMVDDKTPLPGGTQVVEENGKQVKIRTIGEKWSYLQRSQYGANAQPYYVLLSPDGESLNGSFAYNEDVDAFVKFLKGGLENMKK